MNLREALELWLQVTLKTDGKAQTESQSPPDPGKQSHPLGLRWNSRVGTGHGGRN